MITTIRFICFFLAVSLTFITHTEAQTKISGKLKNITLDQSQSPYIAENNLTIEKGDTLKIKKGVVLLFNAFTGMEVLGSLIVEGTQKEPVIFSSANDTRFNPGVENFAAAFDWNGISINIKSEFVVLHHVKVCYSVYGIKSYNGNMVLKNGTFSDNGQYNLVINETIQNVTDGIPFTYNYEEKPLTDTLKSRKGQPLTPYEQKLQNKHVIVYSTLVTGVLSAGLCGFFSYKYYHALDNYNNTDTEFKKYTDERHLFMGLTIGTGSLSCLTLATSLIVQLRPIVLKVEKSKSADIYSDQLRMNISLNSINFQYLF